MTPTSRYSTTNPRTGLRETWNDHLKVAHVHQRNLGALNFTGQLSAVHTVPLRSGITLDFYARFGRADELFVSFHGAIPDRKHAYPRFERVASLRKTAKASIAFADPTILASASSAMRLSWYLGGEEWDPMPAILRVIEKSHGKTGALHVAFVGGSGGGFAALRASAMVPGSMAFVQDPQTRILDYHPGPVGRYFETMWPGYEKESVVELYPERFDMAHHYAAKRPENFVYYAQNASDTAHVVKHLRPFQDAQAPGADRVYAVYDGVNKGHGKITPAEFDCHLDEAIRMWREYREATAA